MNENTETRHIIQTEIPKLLKGRGTWWALPCQVEAKSPRMWAKIFSGKTASGLLRRPSVDEIQTEPRLSLNH